MDEPCDEMDNAGEADRLDEADDWREWLRPRDGGNNEPSLAVIDWRKSVLPHLAVHSNECAVLSLTLNRLDPIPSLFRNLHSECLACDRPRDERKEREPTSRLRNPASPHQWRGGSCPRRMTSFSVPCPARQGMTAALRQ